METFASFVLIMMATLHTAFCTTSTRCVDTCVGQINGNYQHCSDCHQFVACSNGYKYIMPCPSNLVWDDVKKRCEWVSPTCNTITPSRNITTPKNGCVDSCVGQSDGNYQHCSDCHQYVACSNEYNYIMPCPSNLVWDDVKKRCEWTSSTCNETSPKSNTTGVLNSESGCAESCVGRSDGNYQHCSYCHEYVACSNVYKYIMPCPSYLVWDDIKKRCEWTSTTCNITTPSRNITAPTSGCVDSCVGQSDGNYQHCSDCHQYVACSNEYNYIMPCPSNLVWDDVKKRCEWTSSTCNETSPKSNTTGVLNSESGCTESCVGRSDGNYQHCSYCHEYVACSNGYKYIMPCPSYLVWDDIKKRCEWTSTTCNITTPSRNITAPTSGCLYSCVGQSDGNYQHCSDCHQYVACSNEYNYIMPCPSNLVWDDVKKRCEWTSSTCNETSPKSNTTGVLNSESGCTVSCVGRSDGNYQHCSYCHEYVACSNGYTYIMPCPSNLVWDDIKKRCEWTSRTCNKTTTEINTTALFNSRSGCVESCVRQRNGNYQHCSDCHQYIACSNEYDYIMACPSNLVWDDVNKRCEWTSSSCNETTPESNKTTIFNVSSGCVNTCVGRSDGNYQSCSDCHKYVACSNGYNYIMPCPSNLFWDDVKKRCEWTSSTCNKTTLEGCVNSCVGQHDGNYQHCSDCHQYVACSNGYDYIMPCPSNLVWDDVKKRCEWTSSTCNITTPESSTTTLSKSPSGCVESCVDRRDENYQHCSDCHHYVTCSNGYKYIMPCPSNLVWDDVKKRCEWTSPTC